MDEIQLAGFVDRLQAVAASEGVRIFATNDARVSERDAELANLELEQRGCQLRVLRVGSIELTLGSGTEER